MKYLEYEIDSQIYTSPIIETYFNNKKWGFFDIETTGLNHSRDRIILVGILVYENNRGILKQFLAESLKEEELVLEKLVKEIENLDIIVSFNGKSFDANFIDKRYKEAIEWPYHLDLYTIVKKFSPLSKKLKNLKQKTVEEYMGINNTRLDEISGKESIELYFNYIEDDDLDAMKKVLLHNEDDVKQLFKLLSVISKTDFKKALFSDGFPIYANKDLVLVTKDIKIDDKYIYINGRQKKEAISMVSFGDSETLTQYRFDKELKKFEIKIPISKTGDISILNLSNTGVDISKLSNYTNVKEEFMVLKIGNNIQYDGILYFVKLLIERIVQK